MAPSSREALLVELYYHVVLPRYVPGQEHSQLCQIESELASRLTEAARQLISHAPLDDHSHLDAIRLALTTCKSLHVEGKVDKNLLVQEFRDLDSNKALIIHVTEQNAALLVYVRSDRDEKSIIFEAFESTATCESILATENALLWDFPGQAVAVPYAIFSRDDFQQSLSTFIEQASLEAIKQFSAVTYKACAPLPELRDSPDPTLVIELLMAILEASGSSHHTTGLRKRVRDTVSFNRARKPWRRSAFYLVLRVAVQRHLYNLMGPEKGRLYYKTLMCIFMSQLLGDLLFQIPNDATHYLLQKLGRRLAKLEVDHDRSPQLVQDLHSKVFSSLGHKLEKCLLRVSSSIESQWQTFKRRTCRIIRPIEQFANPADMRLQLPNSAYVLNRAMTHRSNTLQNKVVSPDQLLGHYEGTIGQKPFIAILSRYISLYVSDEKAIAKLGSSQTKSPEDQCIRVAREIEAYVSAIGDAYADYLEMKSRQLLTILELWKGIDEYAVRCYPLLTQFHPIFEPSMLDVLQLLTPEELYRLDAVQSYLERRCQVCSKSNPRTIFDSPNKDSFAVKYYESSIDSLEFQGLREEIEQDAQAELLDKETEWEEKSEKHESKIQEMAGLSCVYLTELNAEGFPERVHQKPCRKHTLKWQAKQIKINILEWPLPEEDSALKAVIFELMCPAAFAAYRDATWLILSSFAFPRTQTTEGVPLLREYSGLSDYANETRSSITLGSSTKSHLHTHYKEISFPVTFDNVHRSFGMKFDYYDNKGKSWTSMKGRPSFSHLFPLKLPPRSPYEIFETLTEDRWPTSNKILATQTQCPTDLNVHEYMAWQGLLLGTHTRWPTLLRELGSTNINFSTDSTWALVSKVILQVGPMTSWDKFRDIHSIFREKAFCQLLLEQIDYRLEAIRRNWREPVQLDLLLTMLIKLDLLAQKSKFNLKVTELLSKARVITQGWCVNLKSVDFDQRLGPSIYAVWASVLCKRTFYPTFTRLGIIPHHLLKDFVVASIMLQNSLVGEFDTLPCNLRNAILQDLSSAHRFRSLLQNALCENIRAVLEGIMVYWPLPITSLDDRMAMSFNPETCWATVTISIIDAVQHHIHYNMIHGTLLINGKSLGILPPEYRRWPIIQELFGSQGLHILPSPLPGMSLVIDRTMPNEHWVHLGFRDNHLIIRAEHHGTVLELIPRNAFHSKTRSDLPRPLGENCYHWLDLKTGILEIRQQDPWKSKRSNWRLHWDTRRATRNNGSTLVDPNSNLALRIIQNFYQFEYGEHITVYQPAKGNLRVELKRLELDFEVLKSGLLFSPQLGAAIAEPLYQDVGTWYGLKSKLVVRSLRTPFQRSILLPMGERICKREGPHVSTVVRNNGTYLKFSVNTILGRIECPSEPVMMYHRALMHALTAYFLPDPLTGRTGVDEALNYLRSGAYQPWSPLSHGSRESLQALADLSPQRVYYPPALKVMETTEWNADYTIFVQDERYKWAVQNIIELSSRLSQFSPNAIGTSPEDDSSESPSSEHLEKRASTRNIGLSFESDEIYKPRDVRFDGMKRDNVTSIAKLLDHRPTLIDNPPQLAQLLQDLPIIGGYVRVFDKVQFTDILDTDIGIDWGALVRTALTSCESTKFQLIFLLGSLAFSDKANMDLLKVIASFSILSDLKNLLLPEHAFYSHFKPNEPLEMGHLIKLIEKAKQPYVADSMTPANQILLRELDHEKKVSKACKSLAKAICSQWPSVELNVAILETQVELNIAEALLYVMPEWTRLAQNLLFSQHIEQVQTILHRHAVLRDDALALKSTRSSPEEQHIYPQRMRGGECPRLDELLTNTIPERCISANFISAQVFEASPILPQRPNGTQSISISVQNATTRLATSNSSKRPISSPIRELYKIVAPYKESSSMVHKRYGAELEQSIKALSLRLAKPVASPQAFNPSQLSSDIYSADAAVAKMLREIQFHLKKFDSRVRWLAAAGLWPAINALSLLRELRSTSQVSLGQSMKEKLIALGLAITKYQRLLRIQDASQMGRHQQLVDEYENIGHLNWSPAEYVDWLLLEIESNILIRSEQVDVAFATISPKSGKNSVLQLLMGKGKTSCILPMVALVLSKDHLFRIIVPRPLLLQSAQIMQTKLGGLLDREVLHVPFSRRTPTNKVLMQTYYHLHNHIRSQNGVMLALPEHIMSFKLSGLQRLCDGKIEEAALMIKAQDWLDRHARDVLDECDVSLSIRTQLIYPSGSQQAVDGHPSRWQTVQGLLDLVSLYTEDLVQRFPNSIEVVHRAGFPIIYFLRKDVEEYLINQLIEKICQGETAILPVACFSQQYQDDIRAFISKPIVDAKMPERISELFKGNGHVVDVIYHLRGLFVHRIFLSTLKKRWNVQYGLHPNRDPIAVPYQAKGVPSPTAEWGHPDVAIILTCLSFYYEGLNLKQFKQAFEQLAKSDEPSIEYGLWVAEGVPESLQNYNAINVEDNQQLLELHHYIRHKACLLDFYLNTFIFPQHAKQFSRKLCASGSDLILYDPIRPVCATTGFSGTNDTRHQLPTIIKQSDLPQLAHTNAEVLAYLLEERNRKYIRMVDSFNKRLTEEGLLKRLVHPYGYGRAHDTSSQIRILIDAGAQVLEHDNRSLAKAWLKEDYGATAAVYFNEDHRPMVLYGKGTDIPLVASPFAEDLAGCLVYIDESHCRGTDLKLPPHARAAVTLGPHLTKDALVQAAMRLRLLGKTQSVTFFSPPEVHQSILDLRAATKDRTHGSLSSFDVIRWLLEQTCNAIEQLEPLYFTQGINYLQRTQARLDYPDFIKDKMSRDMYLRVVRSKEMQTLKQLYEPKYHQRGPAVKASYFAPALQPHVKQVLQRKKDFQDRGFAIHATALEEVEQEREMEFEVESVREVQPPTHFKALKVSKLHHDIESFAIHGKVPVGSEAFRPMFCALQDTALGLSHGTITAAKTTARLYVSLQFTRTVSFKEPNDNFLRPCHWLLWSCISKVGLLVSPEEADQLIPLLRAMYVEPPVCHLIVYATPVTRRMLQFNRLDYYAIPPLPAGFSVPTWLKVELGIFTGRLYFEWNEYDEIMAYLGTPTSTTNEDGETQAIASKAFATQPLTFLHDWLAVRRKGQDFEHTPMGFVATGKPLSASHSFFSSINTEKELGSHPTASVSAYIKEDDDESDDGDDHVKDHMFRQGDDANGDDVFHDAEEELYDGEDNTFFAGPAYAREDEDAEAGKQ